MSDNKLTRLEDRVSRDIRRQLIEDGQAVIDLNGRAVVVDDWRAKARAVARDLGRSVRTLSTDRAVHAVLTDWPRDSREEEISRESRVRALCVLGADLDMALPSGSSPYGTPEER